jgi:hypothetical protein
MENELAERALAVRTRAIAPGDGPVSADRGGELIISRRNCAVSGGPFQASCANGGTVRKKVLEHRAVTVR